MENNNTKTLGNFFNNLKSQNSTQGSGSTKTIWSTPIFDFMLMTYLTRFFGDISLVNPEKLSKYSEAIAALQIIATPIVRNLMSESVAKGVQVTGWSYFRFYNLLISHLVEKYGDITVVNKSELHLICRSIAQIQFKSAPVVDNVVNLFASRALTQSAPGFEEVQEEAA